eukprot:TRINITY_DN1292_c0_g1_i1.p1 TRINITY_DN1292_c0_g1~~TRINITY_DN1292_c0_g1_i1.p1  ORF type:complete len:1118 (+),score=393.63 TRINITY_DN1292_c0_g1_i1:767-4120(+)
MREDITDQSFLTLDVDEYSVSQARLHVRKLYEHVFRIKKVSELPIADLPSSHERFTEQRNAFLKKNPQAILDYEQQAIAWVKKRDEVLKEIQEKKDSGVADDDESMPTIPPQPTLRVPLPQVTGNNDTPPSSAPVGRPQTTLKSFFKAAHKNKDKEEKALVDMALSPWNPPTPNRVIQGDLLYLEVKTHEQHTLHITACTTGFYVNSSSHEVFDPTAREDCYRSATLVDLLTSASPKFASIYTKLKEQGTEGTRSFLEDLEDPRPTPDWLARPPLVTRDPFRAHIADLERVEKVMVNHDWNEDYQMVKDSTGAIGQVAQDAARHRHFTEFANASRHSVKEIRLKNVLSLNPMDSFEDQMYLYDNIFFVLPNQGTHYEGLDGEAVMRAQFKQDLRALQDLVPVDLPGLATIMVANSEYAGHFVVSQPIVPGILHRKPDDGLLHGSMDIGKKLYWDQDTHEKLQPLAQHFSIRETKVKDEEGNVYPYNVPVEIKAIVAADGRSYIMDLVRTTPRDLNYTGPSAYHKVVRRELVAQYQYGLKRQHALRHLRKKQAEKKKEGKDGEDEGKSNLFPEPKPGSMDAWFVECLDAIPEARLNLSPVDEKNPDNIRTIDVRFNINLDLEHGWFTHAESEEDLKVDRMLNQHLADLILRYIDSLVSEEEFARQASDSSDNLITQMHGRGINLRYLGRLASAAHKAQRDYLASICEEEMVFRAAKHILRRRLRETTVGKLAHTIAHFFSLFVLAIRESTRNAAASGKGGDAGKKKGKKGKKATSSTSAHGSTEEVKALWEELVADIKTCYDYDIPASFTGSSINLHIALRHICKAHGIAIAARNYNFDQAGSVHAQDIIDVQPVVTSLQVTNSIAESEATEFDKLVSRPSLTAQQAYSLLQDYSGQILNQAYRTFTPIHPVTARVHMSLASLYARLGEFRDAAQQAELSLTITERVHGADHPLTLSGYSTVASYLERVNENDMALEYRKRGLYLASLQHRETQPSYPVHLMNMADAYAMVFNHNMCYYYLQCAEATLNTMSLDATTEIIMYRSIANLYARINMNKKAIEIAKNAVQVASDAFGADDERTEQQNKFYAQLVERTIQIHKRLAAVPAPAAASHHQVAVK